MAERDDDRVQPIDPADPAVRRGRLRLSFIWVVPIIALIAAVTLGARAWLAAGPRIAITFRTAEGLEAGRTEVRYKEVVVGRVERVELDEDHQRVVASVVLDRSAADLAVDDSRFWVVRPRVGATGVTGLGTILSGAYIAMDTGESKERRRRFDGLEAPPYFLRGEPGRLFELSARHLGSLELGSPVYYRRMRVGRVVGYALDPSRDAVNVQVFVEAPNERLVTVESRFWEASGVDISLDAAGLTLNTESLTSMVAGGVAFANPREQALGPQAPESQRFRLHRNRKEALRPPEGSPLLLRMVFDQAPHGLVVDAPVEMLGIEVGRVTSIEVHHDAQRGRFPAEIQAEVYPLRLGPAREQLLKNEGTPPRPDARVVQRLVEFGLRAQVRTGNLLTGQLYVALEVVGPKGRSIDESQEPLTVPSVPATFSDTQQQLADIVKRLSRVEFDRLGTDVQSTLASLRQSSEQLQRTLASADTMIGRLTPEAQEAVAELRRTLQAAQATLGRFDASVTNADAPLQRSASQALLELQRAARALRLLADDLQRNPESLLRGKPADRPSTTETGR
jgi:paraquat-inducible protein B